MSNEQKDYDVTTCNISFTEPDSVVFNELNTPKSNIRVVMGNTGGVTITWCFYAKKNLRNRIKYALFCFFFPFKIEEWNE